VTDARRGRICLLDPDVLIPVAVSGAGFCVIGGARASILAVDTARQSLSTERSTQSRCDHSVWLADKVPCPKCSSKEAKRRFSPTPYIWKGENP
jgi:hypothetical protein